MRRLPLPFRGLPLHGPLLLVALILPGACAPRATTEATAALPLVAGPDMIQMAGVKDDLDTLDRWMGPDGTPAGAARHLPAAPRPVIGRGFAQIAAQPGKTFNQRRLLAIRAARLDAMRDLTEQIHGLHLQSQSALQDATLVTDRLEARVAGTLRGARTRRITPKGDDGYEVEMEIDADALAYLVRVLR